MHVCIYAHVHVCVCRCLRDQTFNPLVSRATGSCDYVCGVGSLKSSIHSQPLRRFCSPSSLPHQPNSWLCSLVSWWNRVLSNSLPVKAKWFYSLALSDYYNFHTTFKVTGRLRKSHWDYTWFFYENLIFLMGWLSSQLLFSATRWHLTWMWRPAPSKGFENGLGLSPEWMARSVLY